jgi:hypothetical protein
MAVKRKASAGPSKQPWIDQALTPSPDASMQGLLRCCAGRSVATSVRPTRVVVSRLRFATMAASGAPQPAYEASKHAFAVRGGHSCRKTPVSTGSRPQAPG